MPCVRLRFSRFRPESAFTIALSVVSGGMQPAISITSYITLSVCLYTCDRLVSCLPIEVSMGDRFKCGQIMQKNRQVNKETVRQPHMINSETCNIGGHISERYESKRIYA